MKIDVSLMPAVEVHNLASSFLSAVKRFYDDPGNEAAFWEWKRQRETIKEAKTCSK